MFEFIKKMFIVLLTNIVNDSNHAKYISKMHDSTNNY